MLYGLNRNWKEGLTVEKLNPLFNYLGHGKEIAGRLEYLNNREGWTDFQKYLNSFLACLNARLWVGNKTEQEAVENCPLAAWRDVKIHTNYRYLKLEKELKIPVSMDRVYDYYQFSNLNYCGMISIGDCERAFQAVSEGPMKLHELAELCGRFRINKNV